MTSPNGAAISDFLTAAGERWTGGEIIVIPTQVQGKGAAESIVAALQSAEKLRPRLDVLVISRGGGSLEDLWCFNEEPVVRAVASAGIPVVSAVGHEIDVTLCDLAADVRALTPTDGAIQALPDRRQWISTVIDLRRRVDATMRGLIANQRRTIDSLQSRSLLRRPHELVRTRFRQLDELDSRAMRAIAGKLRLARADLAKRAASLSALSPLDVLARGYSVTFDDDGNAISAANQIAVGDKIRTKLRDSEIDSIVEETRDQPRT